jgi:type IV fimbrial biogenesis protein FimT
VECCVTLAMAVALVASAVPSLRTWLSRAQPDIASTLRGHLHLARSEAIKSQVRTVVCKSSDGQTCNTEGSWSQGWIVFRDLNNDVQRAGAEPLVWSSPALPSGLVFGGNGSVARYISFQPDGTPAQSSGAFQAGTLTLCLQSTQPTSAHVLVMSATGRIRLDRKPLTQCG